MRKKNGEHNYIIYFFILYAVIYAGNVIYGTFMPVYLRDIGLSKSNIGILLAIGPFIAIVAQPVWGVAADRWNAKNTVLKILLLGSAVSMLLYPVSKDFIYLILITIIFNFFQTSVTSMNDAITLEYLETGKYKFGPVRMSGNIGYAVMSVAAGMLTKWNINSMFALFFIISMFAFADMFKIPASHAHVEGQRKAPVWELFKNRELMIFMAVALVLHTTLGFYNSFFPIYYTGLGASNNLLGWAMFISASSEIPFLFFADRIIKKVGIKNALLCSAAVCSVRWGILFFAKNIILLLVLQVMHGLTYIVLSYCLAIYINDNVPSNLKASGQALNGLVSSGISRTVGSIFGGLLGDMVGIGEVFLYCSIISFLTLIVSGIVFSRKSGKGTKTRVKSNMVG